MFCRKCGSQLADDAMFCHKCGTTVVKTDEPIVSAPIPSAKIEEIAKYDIVLTDITNRADLSEKAHMAVAYVLFEDEIKRVSGGLEPDSQLKRQVQDEATRKAYEMARNLPATLKRSVRNKEALFFKERLAGYGVTVLLGYCPDCGGSLSNMSDRCMVCGQAAIELGDSVPKASVVKAEEPMLGATSSFCRKCGTMSQGEAEFCRKCGSKTGNPPAFTASISSIPIQKTISSVKNTISSIQNPQQSQRPSIPQQQTTKQPSYQTHDSDAQTTLGGLVFTGEKNTNKSYIFPAIFYIGFAVVFIGFAINFFAEDSGFLGFLFLVGGLADLVFLLFNYLNISKTKISMYEKGIKGVATKKFFYVDNIQNLPFTILYDNITGVEVKKEEVKITSQESVYYVFSSSSTEIQSIINQRMN